MIRHVVPAETMDAPAALSRRETETLQLVSTGLISQQIAERLRVTKAYASVRDCNCAPVDFYFQYGC